MTAINMQLVNQAKDIDELADLLPGYDRYDWVVHSSPSRNDPEVLDVEIFFEQRNTVRGKITRKRFGRLEFQRPKSFEGPVHGNLS